MPQAYEAEIVRTRKTILASCEFTCLKFVGKIMYMSGVFCNICFRVTFGSMEYYDKTYDRVTTKNEKKLRRINRIFHKVTTTDDPIIRQVGTFEVLVICLEIVF